MTPYATRAAVIETIGLDDLIAIIPADTAAADAAAADTAAAGTAAAEQLDTDKLDRAIAAANSLIDSKIQIRYTVPIAAGDIPEWLSRAAARIAHYEMCSDAAATTEIIRQRYSDAVKQADAVADGKMKLSINTTADEQHSATRTQSGKAYITNRGGDRQFARPNTRGVL